MRRVHRLALSGTVQSYLDRKQKSVSALNVESVWKTARQTRTMENVVQTLKKMAGTRERCMYCMDSHGSDIEHFWPKKPYPDRTFLWPNMLLCCTECGRFKGHQFPLSNGDQPLLVDPSAEEPWETLDFDPDTGNLTARYDTTSGRPSAKGEHTVHILQLDRRESMAEGYRRTYLRIVNRVQLALAEDVIDWQQLQGDLQQLDDHGLLGWCFGSIGRRLEPFDELFRRKPRSSIP